MRLALDIGNSAVKWATFDQKGLVENGSWSKRDNGWLSFNLSQVQQAMVCASGDPAPIMQWLSAAGVPTQVLTADSPLPIGMRYQTPSTLGPDRIAAACGAFALHPGKNCLVIDAGTCITVDYVDASANYHGGAIMPGLDMSVLALHEHTARLPLIDEAKVTSSAVHIPGRSTQDSILAGTVGATLLALAGFVTLYKQQGPLHVIITGGDAPRLVETSSQGWEHVPHLNLLGLNHVFAEI